MNSRTWWCRPRFLPTSERKTVKFFGFPPPPPSPSSSQRNGATLSLLSRQPEALHPVHRRGPLLSDRQGAGGQPVLRCRAALGLQWHHGPHSVRGTQRLFRAELRSEHKSERAVKKGCCPLCRFMVNRKIFVIGFGLYGSIHGAAEYSVRIEVSFGAYRERVRHSRCSHSERIVDL